METDFGLYIRVYEINPLFSLWIGGGKPDSEPMYISLYTNKEPGDAIDIRTEDAAAFISKYKDDLPEASIFCIYRFNDLVDMVKTAEVVLNKDGTLPLPFHLSAVISDMVLIRSMVTD